jgi:phenylpropionate dioxygenase-like ring-hydroxylating dioxygenase large terminal subunit
MTQSETAVGRPRSFTRHKHDTQAQSYLELLNQESREVPSWILDVPIADVGPKQIPTRWYLDREIHEREIDEIWRRKWQFACRLEHVPSVGDTYVYEVAGLSFLIVRVADDLVKGYWNACLHRGSALRRSAGRVDRLQCPFHGFMWGLDGTCLLIPYEEEFEHIDRSAFGLPEVQVHVWKGFVFINPDLTSEPFPDYVGALDRQFPLWDWETREITLHLAKVFPVNWKCLQEAFMESFHVLTTHPQYALKISESNAFFVADGNFSRGTVVQGQTNEYVPRTPNEQEIFDVSIGLWEDDPRPPEFVLPDGVTARTAWAEYARGLMRPIVGDIVDQMTDTESVDVFYWSLFPNFQLYGGFTGRIDRFRPHGDDHDRSVIEIIFTRPVADGSQPSPPPDITWIPEGEDFTAIEHLGMLGSFLSQDIAIMDGVAKGLRNNQHGVVNFARNQESKIRHFYSLYEQTMGLSAQDEIEVMRK